MMVIYKRWNANTLRELIDGLSTEYHKSSNAPGRPLE